MREHMVARRSPWARTGFALTFATLIVLLAASAGYAQNATVTSVAGAASIERAGASLPASVGMPVETGDRVSVSAGGKVVITLNDSSVLEVGSSSTIIIDEQLFGAGGVRQSTKLRMLSGILRSVVKHSSSGNLPNFEIHTPNAILAARGTTFDTAFIQGQRRFGFGSCSQFTDERTYKGVVGVRNAATPDAAEVLVEAGYETTVPCDSAPLHPGPLGMTGIPSGGASAFTATEPGAAVVAPPPSTGPPVMPPSMTGSEKP